MRIGLDFGTTNSSAALFDGQRVHMFPIDPGARDAAVARSILYLTRDGDVFIGQEAVDTYYRQNTGRPSRMVRKIIGEIEMSFGDVGSTKGYPVGPHNTFQEVYALVDELTPGRLLHSLKSGLAGGSTRPTIFDREYGLEGLIAIFLREVRQRVEAVAGERVESVVLGRPVTFAGGDQEADSARAETRLGRAAEMAGFRDVSFELEPVAAAHHYEQTLASPQDVIVFDLGGGTLDVTVMRVGEPGLREVRATGGVGIGGETFDQRIISGLLLDHFGRGTTWGEQAIPLPSRYTDALSDWQAIADLNRPEALRFFHLAQTTGSHPARVRALQSLVVNNYAMRLIDGVERAKVALSAAHFGLIRLTGQDLGVWQPITRAQFEGLIAKAAGRIEACVLGMLERSGLSPDQIDTVVQTGGSAQIPLFIAMMGRLFGPEKVILSDVFTGVAAGLAIRAAQLEGTAEPRDRPNAAPSP